MRKVANFCDYFVICSGTSDRRIRAIAESIEEGIEKQGLRVYSKQGYRRANWIVLDCSDVVAHVFNSEVRDFYNLERLWQDAIQVSWKK